MWIPDAVTPERKERDRGTFSEPENLKLLNASYS